MSDFLLEIFSEEIPAKMQKAASENFLQIAKESLSKNGLVFDELQIKVFVTPRRLVLYIYRLNHVQKMSAVKRVGPKISADQKAIEGFARSAGVKVTQLEESDGAYVFMRPESEIKTSEIIQKSLPQLLQKMTVAWPKLMRWNDGGARWIRPVRNIACLLGDELIECEFAGLQSNKLTFGRTSKPLPIPNAAHYEEILKDENIVLNQDLRRQKLMEQVHKIKFNLDLELVDDEKSALFDEIIGLCEWPVALVGSIEERFLNLPDEALILTLRNNQKYLCLKDKKGVLASKFIFVANALGNEQKIIADNENLVRARLSDVEFFIQEDLNKPLISRLDDLKKVVFHQKLGSVFERVNRLKSLAKFLSIYVPKSDLVLAERAADLCKVDLTTKAVAELPDLQGKIGSFYAFKQQEDKKIIAAIYEHYLPLGPNSDLPQTALGTTLSIADKIDAIVGFFLADEKPTSSRDPYALRRAALGIIRIGLAHNIAFPIRVLVEKSLSSYRTKLSKGARIGLIEEVIKFVVERLKIYLRENEKLGADVVNLVINQYISDLERHKLVDILYLARKTKFLHDFVNDVKYQNLILLYKRSTNILAIEENKDGRSYSGKPSRLALKSKYESVLYRCIKQISTDFRKLIRKREFVSAFSLLDILELPLTNFFANILVNDENKDARENRLLLLSMIRDLFNEVGDLSRVEMVSNPNNA